MVVVGVRGLKVRARVCVCVFIVHIIKDLVLVIINISHCVGGGYVCLCSVYKCTEQSYLYTFY